MNTNKLDRACHHLVFVYGTLKKGEPNHYIILDPSNGIAEYVGKAKTIKAWPLVIASRFNIPFLLFQENQGKQVIGEVYSVDNAMLSQLDELECHPKYYERTLEEVQFCEVMIMNPRDNMAWNMLQGITDHMDEETSDPEDIY